MPGPDPYRVLVVEDEALIALLMEEMIEALGHRVIGPALTVGEGLRLAGTHEIDCAVLDVNLGEGARSTAVAEALCARGVPFVFATGYGSQGLPEQFAGATVLRKPFAPAQLERAIAQLMRRPPG